MKCLGDNEKWENMFTLKVADVLLTCEFVVLPCEKQTFKGPEI